MLGGDIKLPEFTMPVQYDLKKWSFMRPAAPHMPVTETYVSCPPALVIRDNEGATWTLGFDYSEVEWKSGKWEYDILRNGRKTGEFGRIIEMKSNSLGNREIRIWGAEGWKTWNGRCFV